MSEMPEAAPIPDRPPLHLKGGYLAIASPTEMAEVCFSVPAVRAIRHTLPQGTLVIVTPEKLAALWETVPEVDQIIPYPDSASPRKVASLLKESGIPFDSSIAWQESPAAIAFAKNKIKQRLGNTLTTLSKWITDPVEVIDKVGPIQHRVRDYLLFVEKLGAEAFHADNFKTPHRPEQPEKPRVILVPGSDFGPSAEWPLERFVVIAQAIIDNGTHDLYLLPSLGKSGLVHKLAQKLTGRFMVFEEDLTDTLELMSTSEALIGNDGSIPHLAAHMGTQCIVIFGPNEPQWKRPLGKAHRVVREQVPCSPCLLDKCPLDHRCMKTITVERVLAALDDA